MMDGVSAMDTGNNGQMLNMNIESIGEVKILTQGYQAEYGRSSGLQITAVTKSGTNQFRGSAYRRLRPTPTGTRTAGCARRTATRSRRPSQKTLGYTIGGPVGKPGGTNKLFFFYAHEYRPTTSAINSGNAIRLRVPTALERAGDFSQSLDNNGALIPTLRGSGRRPAVPEPHRFPPTACTRRGSPSSTATRCRTSTQAAGTNYNYEIPQACRRWTNLIQQPAVRLDYQLSSKLRFTGKYSGDSARASWSRPGLIQGFTDVLNPYPYITNYAATVNYTMSPTTFIEGTYGFIRNELAGGNENGMLVNESANRLQRPRRLPAALSGCGRGRPALLRLRGHAGPQPGLLGRHQDEPAAGVRWGGRIGAAPPNQRYPGWLNINRTQDVAVSLTKVVGPAHHQGRASTTTTASRRRTPARRRGNLSFQGYVNFGNDTNNALDTGFGYANAALGVFTQYLQASRLIEGSMIYNNTEFYLQDNWKATNRLTRGLRHALHPSAAAARPVPADVELLPGAVVGVGRRRCSMCRLQQRRVGLLRERPQRHGSAHRRRS